MGVLTAEPQDTMTMTLQPPLALGVISAHGVSSGEILGTMLYCLATSDALLISFNASSPT